jgi:hypothetical protein
LALTTQAAVAGRATLHTLQLVALEAAALAAQLVVLAAMQLLTLAVAVAELVVLVVVSAVLAALVLPSFATQAHSAARAEQLHRAAVIHTTPLQPLAHSRRNHHDRHNFSNSGAFGHTRSHLRTAL